MGIKIWIFITGSYISSWIANDFCFIDPVLEAQTRRIAQNGTIGYGGEYYSISYKMAGQQVLVKETADGLELLIYAQGQLIQRIPKKN